MCELSVRKGMLGVAYLFLLHSSKRLISREKAPRASAGRKKMTNLTILLLTLSLILISASALRASDKCGLSTVDPTLVPIPVIYDAVPDSWPWVVLICPWENSG
jgi:hypothetical protein